MKLYSTAQLPVVVIGAGPIGLAAAAHLLEQGQEPLVLESGRTVGDGVQRWGFVQLFTPWQHNIDSAARRLLADTDWAEPDLGSYPTGFELVERYLRPLAAVPALSRRIETETRVVQVSRLGHDKASRSGREQTPFELRLDAPAGATRMLARAIIDASGTVATPNPLGASGIPAPGELEVREHVVYGLPDVLGVDRRQFAGKRVLVVGSGHSAQNAILDLVELGASHQATEITWAIRGDLTSRRFAQVSADAIVERGRRQGLVRGVVDDGSVALRANTSIVGLRKEPLGVVVDTSDESLGPFDVVIAATGFRPDLALLRELHLDLDPELECPRSMSTLIDPSVHWCGSVPSHGVDVLSHPDPDVFVVGMKSYGRSTSFLMATGYEQVRSIAAALAGDRQQVRDVEPALVGGAVTIMAAPTAQCAPSGTASCGSPSYAMACEPTVACDSTAACEQTMACSC